MKIALYMITGNDFKTAGSATAGLKQMLKKINIDPVDIRRTVIAAFEAEMNVVIHSYGGNMRVILDSNEIEVELRDTGPGIPDIELAMKDGYSTAPQAARELGYGAGMGLPNIKKNTDQFEIESEVGKGTKVCFSVQFKPQETTASGRNSLQVSPDKCRQCMHCLRACPTRALRVRNGKPAILKNICIDCPICIGACKTSALTSVVTPTTIKQANEKTLVVPPSFLTQFTARAKPSKVLAALNQLGFRNVCVTQMWEDALRKAVNKYADEEAKVFPVISPTCPVIVNLIELAFHTLIDNMAPFLSPIEAARKSLANQRVVFVGSCPAELTLLSPKRSSKEIEVILPGSLRKLVQPLISDLETPSNENSSETTDDGISGIEKSDGRLEVSGIKHVRNALEKIENGRLRDVRILDLYACDQGCYGSSFYTEEPFVARYRWGGERGKCDAVAKAYRREAPYRARSGVRLDADVSKAIVKFSEIDELKKSLPGKDCGMCGAPSCGALAEDIVMERAKKDACVHLVIPKGEAS